MTKKETLAMRLYGLTTLFHSLKGNNFDPPKDIEKFVKMKAKEHTIEELECLVDSMDRNVTQAKRDKETEEYYNTQGGAKHKKELLEQREKIVQQRNTLIRETKKKVEDIIKVWLGKEWGVCVMNTSVTIGIIDEERKHHFIFGHTFEIHITDRQTAGITDIKMNYPTMGMFSLTDRNKCKLLQGMGLFVTEERKQAAIVSIISQFKKELDEINEQDDKISEKIKYPFE